MLVSLSAFLKGKEIFQESLFEVAEAKDQEEIIVLFETLVEVFVV